MKDVGVNDDEGGGGGGEVDENEKLRMTWEMRWEQEDIKEEREE